MEKRLIVPETAREAAQALNMSPGIVSNGFLFLTGVTGSGADGAVPDDPDAQFKAAFEKIGAVLAEADLTFDAIAEMTTYHVGLRDTFECFDQVRLAYLSEPYPAWTAVEVAGLRREGALVEIRIIAAMPKAD